MHLARHGTRPPPRPGTRGLSPCLPGRSAREGLDYRRLARAGSDPATARPTPEPSTKHSKSRAPTFRKTASGPSTHWPQSRMPTSSDSRSSCARGRFICRHDRELRDAARARRNQRPALGDGSINRSASRKLDLPPTRLNGSTSSIPGPFRRARNTRILPKVLSVWVHRIEYEQGGWVASLATHAPLCGGGVANGPTTLVSHVSFAGFPCGNAYCLEQAWLGD